jgi:hypothetical protein
MKQARWQFFEMHPEGTACWAWRHVMANGAIQSQSANLETYGAVMCDAIRNGFEPKKDSWDILCATCIAHFEPEAAPVLAPRASDPRIVMRAAGPASGRHTEK